MSAQTIEERLTAVETKLEELQREKVLDTSDGDVPWWKRIVGIYENSSKFEEAVKFSGEWRESEDPENNNGAA